MSGNLATADVCQRIARKVGLRFRTARMMPEDVRQEAACAVVMAARTFDATRGVPFERYAEMCARGRVKTALSRSFRMGRWGGYNATTICAVPIRRALRAGGGYPAVAAIIRQYEHLFGPGAHLDVDLIRSAVGYALGDDVSLDSPVRHGATDAPSALTTLVETLADEDHEGDVEAAAAIAPWVAMLEAMDFTERELAIIRERLLASDPETLETLGDRFGVSRERVRQVEAALIRRIATLATARQMAPAPGAAS